MRKGLQESREVNLAKPEKNVREVTPDFRVVVDLLLLCCCFTSTVNI